MNVHHEFSRHASQYETYNIIQTQVAKKLLAHTLNTPRRILDLGCGSGMLYSHMDWKVERFSGVDFSDAMLECHPKGDTIELILGDFNDPLLFEQLSLCHFDHIYSSSALQWAHDLESVLKSLVSFNTPMSLAIFTAGTFKTLHECAGVSPLLRSCNEVIAIAEKYLDAEYEVLHSTLVFDSVREMFRYIKHSGVSGGRRVLDFTQMKRLMETYPLNYLEFEVVFIFTR